MPRREEFLSNMRDALQSLDPGWDVSPGTPEFKILEAVSSQLENVSIDGLLSTYHFDIDKKSGIELDRFLSLWGFYRMKGSRATGSVTFKRSTPATSDISIPIGTQVSVRSSGRPTIFFSTVAGSVISTNGTEVTVPIEASTGGLIGNVGSYAINSFATSLAGVTEVFNSSPITGGSNSESDEAFRERFRRTFMRNISGTENQFSAVAYQETAFVNRVNSISAVERYNEQIQLVNPSDLTTSSPYVVTRNTDINGSSISFTDNEFANVPDDDFFAVTYAGSTLKGLHKFTKTNVDKVFSIIPSITDTDVRTLKVVFPTSASDIKFVYPAGGEIVGVNVGAADEIIAKSGDSTPDYLMITLDNDWDTAQAAGCNLPVFYFTKSGITRLGGFGTIVDVTYEYTPTVSRNNPPDVVNKLDVFVDGIDEWSIDEQINMPQTEENIFGDSSGPVSSEFIREDGVTSPQNGHLFTPLGRSPIISLGEEINVQRFINTLKPTDPKFSLQNATTYYRDEDYWLVKKSEDPSNVKGSQRSIEGIEWQTPIRLSDGSSPSDETYIFPRRGGLENANPTDEEAPFALTPQNDGNLSGFYSYVVTWEVDGRESLPSHPVTTEAELDSQKLLVRFDDFHSKYPGVYIDTEADEKTVYRRFYRSKSASSQEAAELGPFYLVNIVRNNFELASWIDNKVDDDLGITQPPKTPPPHGVPLNITYSYNSLIERLDAQMEVVRLVGQDILSHQAELIPVKFNFAVVLIPGASIVAVRNAIKSEITSFLNRKQFSGNLQLADLVTVIGSITEVDNVRLLTEEESSNESYRLELSSNSSGFVSSDTITFTVDGYSTSTLFANENSYTIREALEALPSINEGDTYAAFLVNTLTSSEEELYVQGNENSERIYDLYNSSDSPIYLQITQFGSANVEKDEVVKVVDAEKQILDNAWNGSITNYEVNNGVVKITTATNHALDLGDSVNVGYVSSAVDSGKTVTFDAGTNKFTWTNHSLIDNNKVKFALIQTTPVGFETSTDYKVITATANTFQISNTVGGSAIELVSDGSAVLTSSGTVAFDAATDTFTLTDHGFEDDDTVSFSSIQVSSDFSNNTEYFVVNSTTNDFEISTSSGGSPINLTHSGKAIIDPVPVTIIGVTSNTFSYNAVASNIGVTAVTGGKVSTQIGESFRIKFDVERAQLGSEKKEYGSNVTNPDTLAWIHMLGDVSVAKQSDSNGTTFVFTFLPNAFSNTNNWGTRSLIDVDGNRRFTVETSGDFTSSGLVIRTTGQGYGLEVLGQNLQTVLARYAEDIYFLSNQLPVFGGIDVSVRARNTF